MKPIVVTSILISLLCGVTALTFIQSNESHVSSKHIKLQSALNEIPHWARVGTLPMDEKIKNFLALDDYAFQRYSDGRESITLYIGYYHTANKVGAAHDPMVCFPGQGWKIHSTSKGVAQITDKKIPAFSYATITANLGEQSEHILYWFQAYDQPASTTLAQKFYLLKKTLQRLDQDNAFVRISMSCSVKDTDRCEQTLLRFVDDFYPVFLHYVTTP